MVIKIFLPLLVTALFLTGCFSVKSYVDPSFSTTTYEDIVPTLGTFRAKVKVEFQRDGEPYEPANEILKRAVENALVSTGIIIPDVEATNVTMTVVVNNIPESGAAAKGIGVGLTYGLAGTSVIDNYDVSIAYKEPSRLEASKKYQHAIRTSIGFDNGQPPFLGKVKATTTADAFATLVEQVIIEFVADMQREGYLTLVPQNEHGSGNWDLTKTVNTPVMNSSTETSENTGKLKPTGIPKTPDTPIDISGTYISDITSNKKIFFGNTDGKLQFTVEQDGDRITAVNSTHDLKIGGTRKGIIIKFFVEPHRMNSYQDQNGVWEINPDGINITGSWKVKNWRGVGQWNLRRIE